ncbi:MAG: DUF4176 domain-containing protein [Oscillospiraceae bacterium]
MMTGLLPIGTVVLLKESVKRVMIVGVLQKQLSNSRIWDYVGVLYPEGYMGGEKTFLFDTEQIDRIFALGYQDEEMFDFKSMADKKLVEIRSQEQSAAQTPAEQNGYAAGELTI